MLYRHSGKQYSFSLTVGASHSCMRITVMLGVRFELLSMYMSALYVCGKAFNRCMWPVCDADHDKSYRTSSTDAAYASGRSLRIVLNYSPSIPKPHHPNSLGVEILFHFFYHFTLSCNTPLPRPCTLCQFPALNVGTKSSWFFTSSSSKNLWSISLDHHRKSFVCFPLRTPNLLTCIHRHYLEI